MNGADTSVVSEGRWHYMCHGAGHLKKWHDVLSPLSRRADEEKVRMSWSVKCDELYLRDLGIRYF